MSANIASAAKAAYMGATMAGTVAKEAYKMAGPAAKAASEFASVAGPAAAKAATQFASVAGPAASKAATQFASVAGPAASQFASVAGPAASTAAEQLKVAASKLAPTTIPSTATGAPDPAVANVPAVADPAVENVPAVADPAVANVADPAADPEPEELSFIDQIRKDAKEGNFTKLGKALKESLPSLPDFPAATVMNIVGTLTDLFKQNIPKVSDYANAVVKLEIAKKQHQLELNDAFAAKATGPALDEHMGEYVKNVLSKP